MIFGVKQILDIAEHLKIEMKNPNQAGHLIEGGMMFLFLEIIGSKKVMTKKFFHLSISVKVE